MDLKTFINDPDRRSALAERMGTSPQYLWQLATAWRCRRPSPEFAQRIEQATADIGPECVPKSSLRPDIWPLEAEPSQEVA